MNPYYVIEARVECEQNRKQPKPIVYVAINVNYDGIESINRVIINTSGTPGECF